MCPTSGISYDEPAPHSFSFNSPQGACPECKGLGTINEIDTKKIIPDQKISIAAGGIVPLGKYRSSLIFWQIEAIAEKYKFTINTPIEKLPEEVIQILLYGSDEVFKLKNTPLGATSNYFLSFNGIANHVAQHNIDENSGKSQNWANQFIKKTKCKLCEGTRLKKEALHFKIYDKLEMPGQTIWAFERAIKNLTHLAKMNPSYERYYIEVRDRLEKTKEMPV